MKPAANPFLKNFKRLPTMAKLALLTLTVFIALFITFSASKTQHPYDPSITLPELHSKRTILLPSEKPESEPATMVELEQNEKEMEIVEVVKEEKKKPEMRMAYRDLRPVLPRDVDQRMMFGLRHHHHRCRQPYRRPQHQPLHQILFRQFEVVRPEIEIRETDRSYGNDMLIADPEMEKGFEQRVGNLENDMLVADPEMEKGFDEGALQQDLTEIHVGDVGRRRHAPSHWVWFHFGGRHHEHGHHHYHHHHHHDEDEHHRSDEVDHRDHHRDEDEHRHRPNENRSFNGRREENGGGLVKRFRKFLHRIDF